MQTSQDDESPQREKMLRRVDFLKKGKEQKKIEKTKGNICSLVNSIILIYFSTQWS